MRLLSKIIEKVTTTAKRAILFGALVGGVSMIAHATETTVGPTIEKAQLETVEINLDAVVAAITKVDPDWVEGLPRLTEPKLKAKLQGSDWYIYDGVGDLDDPDSYTRFTDSPSELCTEGQNLCAINVTVGPDPDHPDQGALNLMQGDILDAIDNDNYSPSQIRKRDN